MFIISFQNFKFGYTAEWQQWTHISRSNIFIVICKRGVKWLFFLVISQIGRFYFFLSVIYYSLDESTWLILFNVIPSSARIGPFFVSSDWACLPLHPHTECFEYPQSGIKYFLFEEVTLTLECHASPYLGVIRGRQLTVKENCFFNAQNQDKIKIRSYYKVVGLTNSWS